MIFRFDRFFLDEKDLFIFFFGVFVLISMFMNWTLLPFRMDSLFVLFLYLIVTRSIMNGRRFEPYFYITLIGAFLSLVLSPYGLALFLSLAFFIFSRTMRA